MKTQEEIEQLAKEKCTTLYNGFFGYIQGYTQCQEDMADEKLDEDDIKEMALDYIINTGGLPKTIEEWQNALWKFYQSLNKQD
jgi:hypothetical protein